VRTEVLKASFACVTDTRTRVLLLGSLPGEVSLARSQYYAHPQNQFWRLMEVVIGLRLVDLSYPMRLEALLDAGVGLWDVVRTARRAGSLDVDIRDHTPNPLGSFAATLPNLRAIGFNGGKASAIGRKQIGGDVDFALLTLPSSSPAHTSPFATKAAEWVRLRPYLDGTQIGAVPAAIIIPGSSDGRGSPAGSVASGRRC
jgi:TDG/mug DNA glycosylase family protein